MFDEELSLAPLLALSEDEFVEEMLRRFQADGEPRDDEALTRLGERFVQAGLMVLKMV